MSQLMRKSSRSRPLSSFLLLIMLLLLAGSFLWDSTLQAQSRRDSRTRARRATSSNLLSNPMFTVQVASFSKQANAEALFKSLTALGYAAYIEPVEVNGVADYKVKVGKYRELSEMTALMARLRKDGFNPLIAHSTEMDGPVAETVRSAAPASPVADDSAAAAPPTNRLMTAPPAAEKGRASLQTVAAPTERTPATADANAGSSEENKEEASAHVASTGGDASFLASSAQVLQTLGALVFVVALLLGGYLLVKRFYPNQLGVRAKERLLRALDSMPLGDKKSIMLVEVSGDKYLLASTPNEVALLAKIDTRVPPPSRSVAAAATESASASPDFATLLSLKKAELTRTSAAGASLSNAKMRELNKTIQL